jgi:hypothetical protein
MAGEEMRRILAVFISQPHQGLVYIAERSRYGYRKLLWSVMTAMPLSLDTVIEASLVPVKVRRAAYRKIGKS